MNCLYINLDREITRQQAVEENFARVPHTGWSLKRLSAVGPEEVAATGVRGALRVAEKGCFLSHLKALDLCRDHGAPTFVVEDDVLLGENTFAAINYVLKMMSSRSWDIIFTDVALPSVQTMMQTFSLRRELASGELAMLRLDSLLPFGGSTAYLVNGRSTDKIIAALRAEPVLDTPYDLTLKKLFCESRLDGHVVFPFLTSVSNLADASQVQLSGKGKVSDLVWNAFRRLMWAERSLEDVRQTLDVVETGEVDAEAAAFSRILTCVLSGRYEEKGS